MRLTFENTKFKNFLSFGSKWQELEFQPGINVILGRNGSGKSSCMETIPFALFGKTHRDIVKADLINWKNRKGLEVQLTFSKGDNKYKILRAIKPDNFEIYVNDVMIEKASHVKDYQSILEDIVGTNFQTFMSLIHSNINSSKPIFGMSKPDKRKFIEKVFGLTLYSELTDKCNKKLASIDTNLREMELTISHKNSYIKDSEIRVKDIGKKLHSLKDSSIELNNLGEELTTLIDKCIDDEVYENIKQSMDNNNVEISTQDTLLYKFKNKQTIIGTKLKGVIKDIPKKVEFKVEEGLEELYKNNSNDINILQKELQGIDRLITTYKTEISIAKKRVEQLRNGKCPTCGQDAKEIVMKEDGEITNKELELKKASKVYDNQHEKLDRIINEGIEMSDKINKQKSFIESERKRVLLENKKKLWTGGFMKLSSYMEKVDKCKKSLVVKNNVLTEEYELESNLRKSIERLKDNKKVLEDKMSLEGSMRKELEAMISLENKKCKECVADIGKLEQSIRKMNDLKDYMNYIKF
ncbi:AAA family ATPase, partial [Patescibacteria group bacterium]|nr:AAA family ATPase [Patescibacteria group bacterium]